MSRTITQYQQQNQTQDLLEEISAVVGINFEPETIQSTLEENNFDFLCTIAALIQKCKGENKIQTFKAKVHSAKTNPLSGEAPKSEFTSIRSLDVFPKTIGFEPSSESAFMKTGIFEENKKSEEFKESSQKVRKVSYAPNMKVFNVTEEFIKEVKANYKKNVNYYNTSQGNKDNTEKAKVSNKKKLLKIMAFRFINKSKTEALNKEKQDGRYENDEYSQDAESSLYSGFKKLENVSNKKNDSNKNSNYNSNKGSKSDNYKNRNSAQNSNNNKNYGNKNIKQNKNEEEDNKQIGIIDVEVERFFNSNEKQLNELSRQQNSFNSNNKNNRKPIDVDPVNSNHKNFKKQNDLNNSNGRINNFNNNSTSNAYNQNSQAYYENYNYQNQSQYQNNPRFNNNNNFRNQNINTNMNQNYYNNSNSNYNRAYAGNNVNNNSYAMNYNQQNFVEVNYNSNNNKNFNYNKNQLNQYDQGLNTNNFDSRTIQKGTYANNANIANYANNSQNFDDRNGNKKNKMHKGKRY